MSLVCFVQAAEYGVADLSMPALLRALTEYGRLRANEGVLVPLLGKMRAKILKRVLLRIISNYAVGLVAATLAFARAGKTDWKAPDCVGRYSYGFAYVAIIFVPEWQTKSLKRSLYGDALLEVAHAKVAPRYVEESFVMPV